MPELAISAEKVAFLIEKTREFDVKEGVTDPDSGSNPTDDNMIDVLEDDGNDPVAREITALINGLTEDEQVDLIALMRLAAATAESKSGKSFGAKHGRRATLRPQITCSASPWSATIWPRGSVRSG